MTGFCIKECTSLTNTLGYLFPLCNYPHRYKLTLQYKLNHLLIPTATFPGLNDPFYMSHKYKAVFLQLLSGRACRALRLD